MSQSLHAMRPAVFNLPTSAMHFHQPSGALVSGDEKEFILRRERFSSIKSRVCMQNE